VRERDTVAEGLKVALLLMLLVTEKEGEGVVLRDWVTEVVNEEEAVPLGVKELVRLALGDRIEEAVKDTEGEVLLDWLGEVVKDWEEVGLRDWVAEVV
jgi:hypothetical protein